VKKLKEIENSASAEAWNGLDILEGRNVVYPRELTTHILFGTPGLGSTSVGYICVLLAYEVERLQAKLDAVEEALK
jgi:hypothetical protein